MEAFAASRAPVSGLKSFWAVRSLFGVFQNMSINLKAFAASAVLLICLLALGANAYMTSTKSADGLRLLSYQLEPKLQAFSRVKDAVVATHMKIFRYVSWASNGVNDDLLNGLHREIEGALAGLTRRI